MCLSCGILNIDNMEIVLIILFFVLVIFFAGENLYKRLEKEKYWKDYYFEQIKNVVSANKFLGETCSKLQEEKIEIARGNSSIVCVSIGKDVEGHSHVIYAGINNKKAFKSFKDHDWWIEGKIAHWDTDNHTITQHFTYESYQKGEVSEELNIKYV